MKRSGAKTALRAALPVVAFAVVASLAAAGLPLHQASPQKPATAAHKPAQPADLPLIDLAGYEQVLAKYRGKPVLVTFWATWCEPCRDEFPMVVELAKQYAPQGLAVFGVSLDDDADIHLVRRFLAKNQPGFHNYRQKPGIDVDAFYRGVNPAWTGTMPETVFYGRDGRIVGHFVGAQPRASFEEGIRAILGTSGTPGASR
ncbi:MAG TPA: TlpA disulfide reductase family protein [Candidatus Acidoferrum sp.]|nr:TlpA disulfide reductase family protein [Candidatus Acidoferrum sp.]